MFIVSLIIGIICYILYDKTRWDYWNRRSEKQETINEISNIILWISAGIGALSLTIGGICFGIGYEAKEAISIYQEENEKIEKQVDEFVKIYIDYEKDTLKEFKPETIEIMVITYPQLKANELMAKQINVYVENNNKIKELKERTISYNIGKWLLYFG